MKKLILSFIIAMSAILSANAQILMPILRSNNTPSITTSNISYIGQFTANTSTATNTLSQSYTCSSTSNRLIIQVSWQNSSGTITLSDTGGQASGATVIFSNQSISGTIESGYNSGCASGSNTYTATTTGSAAGIVIQFAEYSGITNGAGSWTSHSNGTGTTMSGSITTASNTLVVVFGGYSTGGNQYYTNVTSGFNYRNSNITSGGNPGVTTTYPVFDNLNSSGTVNFSATLQASHSNVGTIIVSTPGIAATSPSWYPTMVQTNSACSSASISSNQNVTSGNLLIYAMEQENNVPTPTSVTDTLGTIFTLAVNQNDSTSGTNGVWIYTGVTSSSGADTITANGTFSHPCSQMVEFNPPSNNVTDIGGKVTSTNPMTWTQNVSIANSIVYTACGTWTTGNPFQMTGIGFTATSQASAVTQNSIGGSWARTISTNSVIPIMSGASTFNVCASIVVH